jgi:hypothetical protein
MSHCEGLYPLGNLAAPKKQAAGIRTVRAKSGQNPGNTSAKYGGPGGIHTASGDVCKFGKLVRRTYGGGPVLDPE